MSPRSTAPAYAGDFPDPFVLRAGEWYFAYGTNAGGANIQVLASPDLSEWHHLGDALPALPGWAGGGFTWAPAVLARDAHYVLYYTVRHRASGLQCVSLATADRPQGPFADRSGEPFIFQFDRGGSIDPSPFVDDDGASYLLWKSDDNALGRPPALWGSRLADDGLSLTGPVSRLLDQDRAWELPAIEAPAMVRAEDRCFLFYSANWWESDRYAVGYATCREVLGRCRKATRWGPWVSSTADAAGPGGQEFFTDATGGLWMAYHAWDRTRVGYAAGGARSLWTDRVTFVDGRPVLGP